MKKPAINWKDIALRLARSIIRHDNDPYASNPSERSVRLARRVIADNLIHTTKSK